MSDCTQMRRKLVTHSSLNMATGETTPGRQEWVTEPCGTPLFGAKGQTLCRSCLSGWTHPNNYPVSDETVSP
jgi:hypothetical protein